MILETPTEAEISSNREQAEVSPMKAMAFEAVALNLRSTDDFVELCSHRMKARSIEIAGRERTFGNEQASTWNWNSSYPHQTKNDDPPECNTIITQSTK